MIPEAFFDTPAMQALLGVIRSEDFSQRVAELGGYSTVETGKVMD